MKVKILFIPLLIAFITASCDENQQVVKKLDGTWEVESFNGDTVSSSQFVFSKIKFNECKLKDNEFCDGQVFIFNLFAINVDYTVSNEGSTLGFKVPEELMEMDSTLFESGTVNFTIVDLEKEKLKLQLEGTIYDYKKVE